MSVLPWTFGGQAGEQGHFWPAMLKKLLSWTVLPWFAYGTILRALLKPFDYFFLPCKASYLVKAENQVSVE